MKSIKEASKEAFDLNEESSKKIIEMLGWKDKEDITKEEFKDFFLKVLYKDDEDRINNLSLGIIDRYIKDFPDSIKVSEFAKWVSYDKFMEAMKSAVSDMFGEQYVQDVVKAFEETEYDEDEEEEEGKDTHETETKKEERVEEL
jgi:hypothetical protein